MTEKTKVRKYVIIMITIVIIFIIGSILFVATMNSDLYGRLIETKKIQFFNSGKEQSDILPEVTLILHKYVREENSIEASMILRYDERKMFQDLKTDTLQFVVRYDEGSGILPFGLNKFYHTDKFNGENYGAVNSVFETNRFLIPTLPSMYGFPFDDIQIIPIIFLYVNGRNSKLNTVIQKNIPGRTIEFSENNKKVIFLTRLPAEKYLVMISSVVFLLLTILLTYSLFTTKEELKTVEELIAVAGYILATAGFKEIVGIDRSNGTSALEILVILIPLLLVFSGLIYSFYKAKKAV